MNHNRSVKLHLPFGFEEAFADKGFWNWSLAEFPDGSLYCVSFTQTCALGANPAFVEAVLENPDEGTRFEHEVGWIVTDEVSEANMQNIVCKLYEQDWFERQRPTTREAVSATSKRAWPPQPKEPVELRSLPKISICDEDELGHIKVDLTFGNYSFETWFSDVPAIENSFNDDGFFAKPGLVVLLEKSHSEIEKAVEKLWNSNWLRYLRPDWVSGNSLFQSRIASDDGDSCRVQNRN